eukprot:COSAG02_NODE_11473_length_1717_cov_15.145374_2_plen_220_part_00
MRTSVTTCSSMFDYQIGLSGFVLSPEWNSPINPPPRQKHLFIIDNVPGPRDESLPRDTALRRAGGGTHEAGSRGAQRERQQALRDSGTASARVVALGAPAARSAFVRRRRVRTLCRGAVGDGCGPPGAGGDVHSAVQHRMHQVLGQGLGGSQHADQQQRVCHAGSARPARSDDGLRLQGLRHRSVCPTVRTLACIGYTILWWGGRAGMTRWQLCAAGPL